MGPHTVNAADEGAVLEQARILSEGFYGTSWQLESRAHILH